MTTTTAPNDRADLAARIGKIRDRITARAADLDAIDARQLHAATAGDEPDAALADSRRALTDAQAVDERAVAVLTARLDQLAAEDRRTRDLADLARVRRQAAEKTREAQAEAEAFPAALDAAHDALRAAAVDLWTRRARVQELTEAAAALTDNARVMAEQLGEPATAVGVVNHLHRLSERYPVSGELPRARVLAAAGRNPADTAMVLAENVARRIELDASSAGPTLQWGGA